MAAAAPVSLPLYAHPMNGIIRGDPEMTIYNAFSLLGGLAFFLFGMKIMGEALEQRAGNKIKPILESLTTKPVKGVIVGLAVTAVIQSSSATTVMLVGFVNSGIMQLSQAINVTMGANIGTTVTAWILSLVGIESGNFFVSLFKPSTLAPIIAFIGIVMVFTSKRKKDVAHILLGFSILMFGMEIMGDSVKGLSEIPQFANALVLFSNPFLGVIMGAVITGIIQSSSASVGILQAIALSGGVTFGAAIPIIMGQNIGTCVTAIISSIGTNRNAKRVAVAHLLFNVIGTIVILIPFYIANAIVDFAFLNNTISAFGIAVVHSLFNVLSTLLIFPFVKQLEKLATFAVRGDKESDEFKMLDPRLLATPTVAISQCFRLVSDMAVLSNEAFVSSLSALSTYSESEAESVIDKEDKVDLYEDKLGSYLVQVSMHELSVRDSREVSKLLHVIGDFERISDHAVNVIQAAREMNDKKIRFSEQADKEINVISAAIKEILENSVTCFINNDIGLASQVEPLEQVVDVLSAEIKGNHVQRVQTGECTIELGFILSDILTNLKRVADHCSNIAVSVIELEKYGELNSHDYLRRVKNGEVDSTFFDMYKVYMTKYSLVNSVPLINKTDS